MRGNGLKEGLPNHVFFKPKKHFFPSEILCYSLGYKTGTATGNPPWWHPEAAPTVSPATSAAVTQTSNILGAVKPPLGLHCHLFTIIYLMPKAPNLISQTGKGAFAGN